MKKPYSMIELKTIRIHLDVKFKTTSELKEFKARLKRFVKDETGTTPETYLTFEDKSEVLINNNG